MDSITFFVVWFFRVLGSLGYLDKLNKLHEPKELN